MLELIQLFFKEVFDLWLAMAPYILLGMIIAGAMHIFLGEDFIREHLGKGGIGSIIKATLLGVPLPVCSCGVIPLAASLRKDGAHKSSVLAFLVSTPTTGIDSILATYSLLGPLFALFRPVAAFVSGITLGLSDYILGDRHFALEGHVNCCHEHSRRERNIKNFVRYAFREVPADIGRWLIYGTLIGAFISALVPHDIFSRYIVFPWDFIAAIGLGIPLYVCATGAIPIVASLMAAGVSPGAALAFLIAGPATNVVTLAFVRASMGKRSFYLYIVNIVVTAFAAGIIFNGLYTYTVHNIPVLCHGGQELLPLWFKILSGVVLLILIVINDPKFPGNKKPSCCVHCVK